MTLFRWVYRIGCLIGGHVWERCPGIPGCWRCYCGDEIQGQRESK